MNPEMQEVLSGTKRWAVAQGDAIDVLRAMPDGVVQACITSPPYFSLRSYLPTSHPDKGKEVGLEDRPDCNGWATGQRCEKCFVCRLTAVFREVRRVLRDDGICVVNLGDSYCNAGTRNNGTGLDGKRRRGMSNTDGSWSGAKEAYGDPRRAFRDMGIKHKDLMGIPWRFALSMQADGWVLRNDCVWPKLSPMPASVEDRLHVAHEYLFVFAKKPTYFWDAFAVRRPSASATLARDKYTRVTSGKDGQYAVAHDHETPSDPAGRHWRTNDVWVAGLDCAIADVEDYLRHLKDIRDGRGLLTDGDGEALAIRVASESYGGEHYAVFPSAMVRPYLLAGTSAKGCCSKCGAPWRRIVEKGEPRPTGKGGSKKAAAMIEFHRGETSLTNSCFSNGKIAPVASAGWEPTCSCSYAEVWPCLVLDCFGGSGTVGMVAEQLGLRSICIDLSEKHVQQARARIATALRQDELKPMRVEEEKGLFAGL